MFSAAIKRACVTDVIQFLNRGFNFIEDLKGIINCTLSNDTPSDMLYSS